jgi:hypothetical protein
MRAGAHPREPVDRPPLLSDRPATRRSLSLQATHTVVFEAGRDGLLGQMLPRSTASWRTILIGGFLEPHRAREQYRGFRPGHNGAASCCADPAGVGRVSGKSRHLENTALLFVWPSISQIYFGAVPRARDPVQPNLVEQIAADAYPPNCHNAAVLTHANNRVVSAIGDVKIGPLVQARVASPIDVVRIYFDGRQVDRQIQC